MNLNVIGIADEITSTFITPMGKIKVPCRIEKVDVYDKDYKDCDFFLYLNDVKIDITLPIMYAFQDMEAQNQRASEMEKKYNQHDGRYIVKDMTVVGVDIDTNWNFRFKFVWTDCYDCKRGYYGHECRIRQGVDVYYLSANIPQFYF